MVTGNLYLLHIMNFENLYKRGLFFQEHTVSEEKLAENPGEPTLGLKLKILGWFIVVEVERQAAGSPHQQSHQVTFVTFSNQKNAPEGDRQKDT